jgi:hypothetical protein
MNRVLLVKRFAVRMALRLVTVDHSGGAFDDGGAIGPDSGLCREARSEQDPEGRRISHG